jgi:hypothetical protein
MTPSPTAQLVALCKGDGAVLSRIVKEAPFLRDLAATKHAHQALFRDDVMGWEHSAHALLNCVTKPRGAAGFGEQSARFVRACLSLDGGMTSFAQRMDNLANDPQYNYFKSRNTQVEKRREKMGILAGCLLQLQSYLCDPGKASSAARHVLKLIEFTKEEFLGLADEEEIREFYDEVRRNLPVAVSCLDRVYSQFSLSQRLVKLITTVVDGPYRRVYADLKPRSDALFIPPDEILQDYLGLPSRYSLVMPITERTEDLIERIILDVESQGEWESVLRSSEAGNGGSVLDDGENTRPPRYFEGNNDEPDYPDQEF